MRLQSGGIEKETQGEMLEDWWLECLVEALDMVQCMGYSLFKLVYVRLRIMKVSFAIPRGPVHSYSWLAGGHASITCAGKGTAVGSYCMP